MDDAKFLFYKKSYCFSYIRVCVYVLVFYKKLKKTE